MLEILYMEPTNKYYTKGLVSVIIPMYNVQKYIGKCIKSILQQSYSNIEVIAVNDCSPDKTMQVVQRLADKDCRVQFVNLLQNAGVSNARYQGLLKANGEYIMFVDGDDYLPINAIQVLVEEAIRSGADVIEGGMNRVLDDVGLLKRSYIPSQLLVDHNELMDKYFISYFGVNILGVQLWGKLYKHTLIDKSEGLKPTSYKMGEDLMANIKMFPLISRYSRIPICVYNYRWGGITSHYNITLYDDIKSQYYAKIAIAKSYNFNKAIETTKIEMCNVLFSNLVQLIRFGYGIDKAADFLNNEINSGFVDEITMGVEYAPLRFQLLKAKDERELINLAESEALNGKIKRTIAKFAMNIVKLL